MRFKFKKTFQIGKILLVNTAVLFIGIIILELFFGNWFKKSGLHLLSIPRNVQLSFKANNIYQSEDNLITYSRDEFGFRGIYNDVGDIDILTVGGSTTNQLYVTDGKTWQDVIHKEFEFDGKEVYIVNAGVNGHSTVGHIKSFEKWFSEIPNLKAKYILFYIGLNDLSLSDGDFVSRGFDHIDRSSMHKIERMIRDNSAMFYLARLTKGYLRAKRNHLVEKYAWNYESVEWDSIATLINYNEIMSEALREFEIRLKILANKTREMGSIPIFVTQTTRVYKIENGVVYGVKTVKTIESNKQYDKIFYYNNYRCNSVDQYHMQKLINDKLIEVCIELNCISIDLATELNFDLEEDFYDSVHSTPSGSEKIGKFLYQRLKHLF